MPALRRSRLSWVKQNFVRAETLTAANAALVAAQNEIALARGWGGGEVASADGPRFVVPVRTIHSGPNPRYFGRERGVTWYNLASDQYTGLNAITAPGTLRDSLNLLAVVLEQETDLNPTEIMSDTAGYTDAIFGIFHLLGYQFSPRIADIGGARFWRVDGEADYGVLDPLAADKINVRLIAEHWDDLLRLAGSLKLGVVRAGGLTRTLQTNDRPTKLARALRELGRLVKTLYLLRFIDDEGYRRRILTQLNRGEGRHKVARTIFHGNRGELARGRGRPSARQAPAVAHPAPGASHDRPRGRADPDRAAARGGPLDRERHGRGGRDQHQLGAADLARPQAAAAPGADLQAVQGPGVRRQAARHRRALPRPAGARGRPVRRREAPDPGPRPHPARAAREAGPVRDRDPRLRAERDHDPVRGPERARRDGGRPVHAAPPPPGVPALPERGRGGRAGRQAHPRHPGQLRHPQALEGPGLAGAAPPLDLPLHPDLGLVARRRRGLLRQADQATAQARRVRLARRVAGRDQSLPRRDQCRPQAVRLDRQAGAHPRKGPSWEASVRPDPLVIAAVRPVPAPSGPGERPHFLPPHRERHGRHQVAVVAHAPALRASCLAAGQGATRPARARPAAAACRDRRSGSAPPARRPRPARARARPARPPATRSRPRPRTTAAVPRAAPAVAAAASAAGPPHASPGAAGGPGGTRSSCTGLLFPLVLARTVGSLR